MSFELVKLYHPSHRVPDLQTADHFFQNVFGIASVWRSQIYKTPDPKYPTFPTDYCIFTTIADVFFDCIDPRKYIIDGVQRYATVSEPHLNGFGWGVKNIDGAYEAVQSIGIVATDQADRPSDPEKCPIASFNTSKLFYTTPESSGIRLEFYPIESVGSYDPRKDPSWKLNPKQGKGSLGIQFCSHHTTLTNDMDRALKLYRDLLGGKVICEDANTLRGTRSIFIQLADAVHEIAVPTKEGTYAQQDFAARIGSKTDVYHALTWKVLDLDQARSHLEAQGVRILARNATMIVTEPQDGMGIPWGFTVALLPGDTRYLSDLE
jgi:catechol 2,3-dioxygenase-like lactoylglutathione lyase family enzyme